MTIPDKLPCHPCPHNSVCCTWGASLEEAEAIGIIMDHKLAVLRAGHTYTMADFIEYSDDPGDPRRTWVIMSEIFGKVRQHCIFSTPSGCLIHDKPYYPQICRGFPWLEAPNVPYTSDVTICPVLVQIVEPTRGVKNDSHDSTTV